MDKFQQTNYTDLFTAIKNGDKEPLHEIYVQYRAEFVTWAMTRYYFHETEAKDIYQEVIIAFYENIVKGKITHLQSSLKTYLFGIGKYLILHHFKKNSLRSELHEQQVAPFTEAEDWSILKKIKQGHQKQTLRQAINTLNDKCRKLLILFYYRRYAMEAIMHELNYKNPQVAKSSKIRCMNVLRKLVEEKYDEELRS